MRVFIQTFGCQMNRLDSDLVTDLLGNAGYTITTNRDIADLVLYNTCSVRDHAEQKVYSRLGRDAQLKVKPMVGVIGCMAQRLGGRLKSKFPVVDIVCAPGSLYMLPELIDSALAGRAAMALDPSRTESRDKESESRLETMDSIRHVDGDNRKAFVRVMRGCDKFCSYCIVPFVRGPERSRNPAEIQKEVAKLVEGGKDCITLLGQTVNSYKFQDVRFSDLVRQISAIPQLKRLDFVTSHPTDFGQDILEAIGECDNVCSYIHCPAQSGSDRILRAMNRGYTRAEYDAFLDLAYRILPDVAIASDFIVGFPGESDEDHAMTIDLVEKGNFKNCFIFKYSPRDGTRAAEKYQDNVPEEIKRQRNNELLEIQRAQGLKHHQNRIGRTFNVMVEGPSRRHDKQDKPPTRESTQMMGRTMGNHIVLFDAPDNIVGSFVSVKITDANDLALIGEVC